MFSYFIWNFYSLNKNFFKEILVVEPSSSSSVHNGGAASGPGTASGQPQQQQQQQLYSIATANGPPLHYNLVSSANFVPPQNQQTPLLPTTRINSCELLDNGGDFTGVGGGMNQQQQQQTSSASQRRYAFCGDIFFFLLENNNLEEKNFST
jgi:hypothetical protein